MNIQLPSKRSYFPISRRLTPNTTYIEMKTSLKINNQEKKNKTNFKAHNNKQANNKQNKTNLKAHNNKQASNKQKQKQQPKKRKN